MSKKWIFFVAKRFSLVDHKSRTSVNSRIATVGICIGVMTLIVVMSVMNGFQHQFIDSILEISSYHAQIKLEESYDAAEVTEFLDSSKLVVSYTPFVQSQAVIVSSAGKEASAVLRALSADVIEKDPAFSAQISIVNGAFDLSGKDSIVLGYKLARALNVRCGSEITLLVISSSSSKPLVSSSRKFKVTGIFSCGYQEINSAYAFINLETALEFKLADNIIVGIKLDNPQKHRWFVNKARECFPLLDITGYSDYNKSFFSTLRTEKNMLFLMTFLIFLVVGINIFNSMRKIVYSRKIEIAAMSSLGGSSKDIQKIFIYRGLKIGLTGSLSGMILGIFLSLNVSAVFLLLSKCQYAFDWISAFLFDPQRLSFLTENPMYAVYASISARIQWIEVLLITVFGISSCIISSLLASSNVLKISVSEVLHEE